MMDMGVMMDGRSTPLAEELRRSLRGGHLPIVDHRVPLTGAISHRDLVEATRRYMVTAGWGAARTVGSYGTANARLVPDLQSPDGTIVVECGRTQVAKLLHAVQTGRRFLWVPYPTAAASPEVATARMFGPGHTFCWAFAGHGLCGRPSEDARCEAHVDGGRLTVDHPAASMTVAVPAESLRDVVRWVGALFESTSSMGLDSAASSEIVRSLLTEALGDVIAAREIADDVRRLCEATGSSARTTIADALRVGLLVKTREVSRLQSG